jgi:hypothetical protein
MPAEDVAMPAKDVAMPAEDVALPAEARCEARRKRAKQAPRAAGPPLSFPVQGAADQLAAVGAPLNETLNGVSTRTSAAWDALFGALCAFRQQHGHLRVSRKVGDVPTRRLGEWMHRQRLWYRALRAGHAPDLPAHVAADRIAKLDALGFVWDFAAGQIGRPALLGRAPARKRRHAHGAPRNL